MHRKSHLDERLEACSDILKISDLTEKNMRVSVNFKEYLNFEEIFKNDNPVRLEIGCGKGKFVCETAALERDINFIAVEKISNVLIDACERAKREGLKNVYFLNCAAEVLQKYIPPKTVEEIYLNFSNPLPKEGYKKQRLTHPVFLGIYRDILKEGGRIVQKTDDYNFYLFSLESYMSAGYNIVNSGEVGDLEIFGVETEHEKKFKALGKKIYGIVAEVN